MRKASVQSPLLQCEKGLNTTVGLYLYQVWWHKINNNNNNNQATKALEKYELIRSLSVLYQTESGMTPVCTWAAAKINNKNKNPLKDVEETTSVTSCLWSAHPSCWLKPTHSEGPRHQLMSPGQVWPEKKPLVQFPHVTPTPAACSCLLLWSDTMYAFQLLHPSSKQQRLLCCFCTWDFFSLVVGFHQDSSL